MVPSVDPLVELVAIVVAAGVAGFALGVDGLEGEWRSAEVGDQAIVGAHQCAPVGVVAGVADGDAVASDRYAAAVEELAQVAAPGEHVP